MIGKRYVDGDKLMDSMLRASTKAGGGNAARIIGMTIERLLKKAPKSPKLIGRKRAAEILGVGSPYISQLIKTGKMPDPIKVEGGHVVYDEAEVKAFANRRRYERPPERKKSSE